jgi:hypothetical protein
MTHPDFFAGAIARIYRWMALAAAAGAVAALVLAGWPGAVGFLLGAAISWLNFRWLKRLVDSLGAGPGAPPRARAAVFLGLRYALLALVAYVILRFSVLNLPALLGGIFVAVAAVILEIIFELLYARN